MLRTFPAYLVATYTVSAQLFLNEISKPNCIFHTGDFEMIFVVVRTPRMKMMVNFLITIYIGNTFLYL